MRGAVQAVTNEVEIVRGATGNHRVRTVSHRQARRGQQPSREQAGLRERDGRGVPAGNPEHGHAVGDSAARTTRRLRHADPR